MKEIKIILLLVLVWAFSQMAFAQTASKELKIGDQVPELEFANLINSKNKSIKLSDLKGKLVILDFWATWCVPCVAALPKMDSLQKKFKDQLVILPITYEKRKTVESLFINRPDLRDLSLQFIFETNLKSLFPHRIVPHEVWIDATGKICAVTSDKEVTAKNIKQALNAKLPLIYKKIDITDHNKSLPFIAGAFGSKKIAVDQVLYGSMIIEGFEGLPGIRQSGPIRRGKTLYISFFNARPQQIYLSALAELELPPLDSNQTTKFYQNKSYLLAMPARISWEAKDKSLYKGSSKDLLDKPYKDMVFNYELILPDMDKSQFRKLMLEDLNRFFGLKYGITGQLEKRVVECWALQVIGDTILFKTKGGKKQLDLERQKNVFRVSNTKIDDILFIWLKFHIPTFFPKPIINETNYNDPVDFDLGNVDPADFDMVNERLKQFGLQFRLVQRELDMIVFKEKQ